MRFLPKRFLPKPKLPSLDIHKIPASLNHTPTHLGLGIGITAVVGIGVIVALRRMAKGN
jgi:hypothetical protein